MIQQQTCQSNRDKYHNIVGDCLLSVITEVEMDRDVQIILCLSLKLVYARLQYILYTRICAASQQPCERFWFGSQ